MIVLVSPVSGGVELARAFIEQGVKCVHLYDGDHAEQYAADPNPRKFLAENVDEAVRYLTEIGATDVLAASEYGVTLADEISERFSPSVNSAADSVSISPADSVADSVANSSAKSVMDAGARRDKLLMMRLLEDAGVPAVRTRSVSTAEEMATELAQWPSFPLIVKPRDSAGGDGCYRCETPAEVGAAFEKTINQRNLMGSVNDDVLLQEYLDGQQFMVNTVTLGGRHLMTDFYACRIDNDPDGPPFYRHGLSRRWLSDSDQEIISYVFSCLDALGMRDGAGHTEVRLTSRGPRLVEVNSRLMGPCLAPDPYFVAFGYSHQHLFAESRLDPDRFLARLDAPYEPDQHLAVVFLRADRDGIITAIPGLERLRRLPGFHSIGNLPEVGQPTRNRFLADGVMGIAFLVHPDEAVLTESLATIHGWEDAGEFYAVRSR